VVVEAFGVILSKAYNGGLLEGFKVRNSGMKISQLQFVDDTLVLSKNK